MGKKSFVSCRFMLSYHCCKGRFKTYLCRTLYSRPRCHEERHKAENIPEETFWLLLHPQLYPPVLLLFLPSNHDKREGLLTFWRVKAELQLCF